jgi:hypothetical protein
MALKLGGSVTYAKHLLVAAKCDLNSTGMKCTDTTKLY